MKLMVFAVYDEAVGLFMQPIFMRSKAEAVRALRMALASPDHTFSKSPRDYSLHQLGEFNEESGTFVSLREFVVELEVLRED